MEILILGCGRVGGETAKALVKNACNVTVVDNNINKLLALQSMYDLRTVHGNAAEPAVLRKAGGENAEIVIAVTAIDEVNLVSCRLCSAMFKTPKKIARLRSNALNTPEISGAEGFDITHIFSPEQIVADNICGIIRHPGCLSVHQFTNHDVALVSVRISAEGEMAGCPIGEIRRARPDIDFRAVAVYRDQQLALPDGTMRLFVGDEVSVIAAEKDLDALLPMLAGRGSYDNIMIAGGGNIGERIARQTSEYGRVKIIEKSQERCARLSEKLNGVLVVKGDASNEHLLREENIAETDAYCAVTNDDEENILSSLLAKRLGARREIVLVNRPAYAGILARLLDNVVSPAELSIGAILAHIRAGDIGVVHSLHDGKAEAIEAVIHGDPQTSPVVGREIAAIDWPKSAMPGALVRGGRMIIAHDRTLLQDGDRLIIYVDGRKALRQVEKLLQVSVSFF
ncbi:MAG: Trk system potassium transporter TrkA [Gammaproteobacteria bacterium]